MPGQIPLITLTDDGDMIQGTGSVEPRRAHIDPTMYVGAAWSLFFQCRRRKAKDVKVVLTDGKIKDGSTKVLCSQVVTGQGAQEFELSFTMPSKSTTLMFYVHDGNQDKKFQPLKILLAQLNYR